MDKSVHWDKSVNRQVQKTGKTDPNALQIPDYFLFFIKYSITSLC